MKELLEKIETAMAAFTTDANAQLTNGNKAAGTRARKASLEVEKMMKEFRKVSIEASKQ
ncbi:MAG: histone H1 [Rikenellaceae bacterium]